MHLSESGSGRSASILMHVAFGEDTVPHLMGLFNKLLTVWLPQNECRAGTLKMEATFYNLTSEVTCHISAIFFWLHRPNLVCYGNIIYKGLI